MKKLFIVEDLKEKNYFNFLSFCHEKFERMYLYERQDFPEMVINGNFILEKIRDELIRVELTTNYRTGETVGYPNIPMKEFEIKCTRKVMELVYNTSISLFSCQQPLFFEDLCFESSDGSSFMSLAHEGYGFFIMKDFDYQKFETNLPNILMSEKDFFEWGKKKLAEESYGED